MRILLLVSMVFMLGCTVEDEIQLPDPTDRVELLEANDALQDLRLNALESRVTDLEARMADAEFEIDANTENINVLFSEVDLLDQALIDLRDEFSDEVRSLRRADRATRRLLRNKVRNLRRRLSREIRQRRLADNQLQDQIDNLEDDLDRAEARQQVVNRFLFRAMVMTNFRISRLQSRIMYLLGQVNNRIDGLQDEINEINDDISEMQDNISDMQVQIDDVESRLVSVVYPCGEDNSEEVLLKTQDGLVAYIHKMKTKTRRVEDSITVPSYEIPGHYDKYCVDTSFFSGNCNDYNYRWVSGTTIPSATYSVGDTVKDKYLQRAYLDVLDDGNYRTTDGHSCNFTIYNGEVVND